MIPSGTPRKIKRFAYIDFAAQELGWLYPGLGETLIGIPYGWYVVGSTPCIEIHKEQKVVGTINCAGLLEIDFED